MASGNTTSTFLFSGIVMMLRAVVFHAEHGDVVKLLRTAGEGIYRLMHTTH